MGDYVANTLRFSKGAADQTTGRAGGSGGDGLWGGSRGFAAAYRAHAADPTTTFFSEPIEEAFPDPAKAVPSELVAVGDRGLYEAIQTDSEVERSFVQNRLEAESSPVRFYFKFPPSFRIKLPKVIGGNYNPDWGICLELSTGKTWIVRETKGTEDILKLRFSSEARKIVCGYKYFQALGIQYRAVSDKTDDWTKDAAAEYRIKG